MIAEIISGWDVVIYSLRGIYMVLEALIKCLFTSPLLPFTVLGLISLILKLKTR